MVVEEILHALPIPDPRPARANPEERKKRKQYEKENPHFQMQEFGLKAGVLALMGALAVYPWEKKYDEHVKKHHPERLERRKLGKEGRGGDGGGSDDGRDNGRKDRRKSVNGSEADGYHARSRSEGRTYTSVDENWSARATNGSTRSRRQSVADVPPPYTSTHTASRPPQTHTNTNSRQRRNSLAPDSRGRIYIEEDRIPAAARRRSVDRAALRMAVADGYSYIPSDRKFVDVDERPRGSLDSGRQRDGQGERYVYEDGYQFRPRRVMTVPNERRERR